MRRRLPPFFFPVVLVVAGFCATSPGGVTHELDEVEPSQVPEGEEAEIEIRGAGFDPIVSYNVGCAGETLDPDSEFSASLDDHSLEDIHWISPELIRARVPDDLEPGLYELSVTNPLDEVAYLDAAFEVVASGDGDSDVDSDTDSDTDPWDGDGSACGYPILLEGSDSSWSGVWGDFGQSFTPMNACGTGDQDIWFAVYQPAGTAIAVSETGPVDVLVRRVDSCDSMMCLDWVDEPEWLCIEGGDGGWRLMSITETGYAATYDEAIVKLEHLAGSCDDY